MTLLNIFGIIQTLIWVFPIFRQWKSSDFKYFFLVLGIQDFIIPLGWSIFNIYAYNHYIFWFGICAFSLTRSFHNKRNLPFLVLSYIPLIILLKLLPYRTAEFILTIIILVVLFLLLRKFVLYFSKAQTILLFHIVLITYMFCNVMKMTMMLVDIKTGFSYFFITSFFQIFFAIYFMIDSDYKPRFILYNGNIERALNKTHI